MSNLRHLFLLLLVLFTLVACGPTTAVNTRVPPTVVTETLPPAPTPTLEPTPTTAAPRVVLLAPEGSDAQVASALQSLLTDLSAQAGWRFEVQPSLSPADLTKELRVAVVLPPDPGLMDLAAAAPQTQFLAVGIPGAEPGPNLSVIGAQGARPDQSAFLAGYLAAVITQDWRVGVVAGADPVGKSVQLGFTNGATYFCGLCRPAFPPFPTEGYPLEAELAAGAGQADWQNAAANFKNWGVQTVYVDPGIASGELLEFLAGQGFNLIGAGPRPQGMQERWVASLGSGDLLEAVRQAWPKLAEGQGESQLDLALAISDINESLLSPGRQRQVQNMLADLAGGFIDTGVGAEEAESP